MRGCDMEPGKLKLEDAICERIPPKFGLRVHGARSAEALGVGFLSTM